MDWVDESAGKKLVYTTTVDGRSFVAQKERTSAVWRLFTSDNGEPLRVIYVGDTLDEIQQYAEVFSCL